MERKDELMRAIDDAKIVSFDVFDTLLFRKVNEPEIIFDLVGKHFGIHGFRKIRTDAQNEASQRAYKKFGHPHADMNEIYEVLKENKDIDVKWEDAKQFEISLERDSLVANPEMLDVFNKVKKLGKRVIATTDMYLLADTIKLFLEDNGFSGFDFIYCSADEYKAKFNKELFEEVALREKCEYKDILHIGDNKSADVEIPGSLGISTFHYVHDANLEKLKDAGGTDIDKGIFKILYDADKGFWYNLGVEAGGPIYLGLTLWIEELLKNSNKTFYFLARDGYNLYKIFKKKGYSNIKYLYTSRRSLILAGITELDDESVKLMPPYTKGQTVGEILEYLCIDRNNIVLNETGINSFDYVIRTEEDFEKVYSIYRRNSEVILRQCQEERKAAWKYFKEEGFLDADSYVFDCGWNGSSQYLIDRFKKAVSCEHENYFLYFGIMNTEKSRRQLHGKHYKTYLFDFYRNFSFQNEVNKSVVIYEMFFSAPHESVFRYGENEVIFEPGNGDDTKEQILQGIMDYLEESYDFVKKYGVEITSEKIIGHISRIVSHPTKEEVTVIGNVEDVDGFVRKNGVKKYIAYISEEQFRQNPNADIYWIEGLLRREDVSDYIKKEAAKRFGIVYPKKDSQYHLEMDDGLMKYRRWLRRHSDIEAEVDLKYRPMFSIVMPVYNTVDYQLREAIDSVLAGTYENYELILVDDCSTWGNVVPTLKEYESDPHISVIYREKNGHISTATNDGIAIARGDFLVFMDCDDLIAPNALYEIAKKLNENPKLDFIYSDEDKITEDGKIRHLPFFKPEWSPDLFWGENYTNHLSAYRMEIVRKVGGLRSAYDGAQDYDFVLRFMEYTDNSKVGHISKILYHWRERKESVAFAMGSKNYAAENTRYAKEDALRRRKISGRTEYISEISQYRVVFEPSGDPGVSIIIPSKDNFAVLKQCIDSVKAYTHYPNYEIVVVDNGSSDENREKIEKYLSDNKCTYVYDKFDFNFSKMCNLGAKNAKNDYYLFLNDDIEIFQEDWLDRLMGQIVQKNVGIVGAKLYYPESTVIQHAGVSNTKEGPFHNFNTKADDIVYYFGFNRVDYNVSSVTGACLLIGKAVFEEVGGFNEELSVSYNDIDLCFRVHEHGYYLVVRQDVCAYHHESLSRGSDFLDEKKFLRFSGEKLKLYRLHPEFEGKDPYLNENLHFYYGPVIDLNDNKDEVTKLDDFGSVPFAHASIDQVIVDDEVKIDGWAFIPERTDNADLDINVIFEDIYGVKLKAPAVRLLRNDLVDAFDGREDLRMCGFECIVDKNYIRMDSVSYKVGVQVIDKEGTSHIYWNSEPQHIMRNALYRKKYCESRILSEYSYCGHSKDIRYSLDYCGKCDEGIKIDGWAFCNGDIHYQYRRTLILSDGTGIVYECEMPYKERSDVAIAIPEVKFLCKTGFEVCFMQDDFGRGKKYDVIIRFENVINPEDVQEIVVGRLKV